MPKVKAEVGLICVAPYEGDLYRARVTSINAKVNVHFIDYGNWQECEKTDLLQVPENIRNFPGLVSTKIE